MNSRIIFVKQFLDRPLFGMIILALQEIVITINNWISNINFPKVTCSLEDLHNAKTYPLSYWQFQETTQFRWKI